MLHKTDAELFAMIERRCGWDLSAMKEAVPRLAEATALP
jgi:hypothetical protein